jgi:hypothetical protein
MAARVRQAEVTVVVAAMVAAVVAVAVEEDNIDHKIITDNKNIPL